MRRAPLTTTPRRQPYMVATAGLVVNGQRILDLASAKDRRVSIRGNVELDIASRRTEVDDDDKGDDEW